MLESASDKKILTIDSCLNSAEALVNSHSYNQALSILKRFDYIGDTDKSLAAREKHQKLMLFILEIEPENPSYILNNIELAELVTTSQEGYIEKLVDLASSPMKIINYKNIIHEKYMSSSTDTSTYARGLAKLLQKLWLSHLDDSTKDLYKS
jgi:hypothetical protein